MTAGPTVAATPAGDVDRDLAMEAHLRAISIWIRVSAVLIAVLMMILGVVVFGGLNFLGGILGERPHEVAQSCGTVIFLVLFMFILPWAIGSYLVGHGLARYANGARVAGIVLMSLGLLGSVPLITPFGRGASSLPSAPRVVPAGPALPEAASRPGRVRAESPPPSAPAPPAPSPSSPKPSRWNPVRGVLSIAWTITVLVVLVNPRSSRICTYTYREAVKATPELEPPTFRSPFFWMPIVCFGLAAIFP